MHTLSHLETTIHHIFNDRACTLARQTGFIQRERNFNGADFLQSLVFGWLHQPQSSLDQLSQIFTRRDVQISSPGLSYRFTPACATFLHTILEEVVTQAITTDATPIPLLQRFSSVVLEDSSIITLPDELRTLWPGCGGGGKQSRAGLKLHVRWDLLHGGLQGPIITSSRTSDHDSPLRTQDLEQDQLYITDEGYFSLTWLKKKTQAGHRYFLIRPRCRTVFFDQKHHRLNLAVIGPQRVNDILDIPVIVGTKVRLAARLIMVRVPQEVYEQRQENIRETARRHSSVPTAEQLEWAAWTILLTNVPMHLLSGQEVVVLQRARWQVERLFRLWKSDGWIDEWQTKNPWRILCEIYAKLIAMVVQHWILLEHTWQDPFRSLVKAAKVVREYALEMIDVLMGERSLTSVFEREARTMKKGCQVTLRAKDPCLAQLLLEGIPWFRDPECP